MDYTYTSATDLASAISNARRARGWLDAHNAVIDLCDALSQTALDNDLHCRAYAACNAADTALDGIAAALRVLDDASALLTPDGVTPGMRVRETGEHGRSRTGTVVGMGTGTIMGAPWMCWRPDGDDAAYVFAFTSVAQAHGNGFVAIDDVKGGM